MSDLAHWRGGIRRARKAPLLAGKTPADIAGPVTRIRVESLDEQE